MYYVIVQIPLVFLVMKVFSLIQIVLTQLEKRVHALKDFSATEICASSVQTIVGFVTLFTLVLNVILDILKLMEHV